MLTIILGVFVEGLVYAIMALGVYITYKILDFPDLSVDGTFPMGGAVSVVLIVAGVNPYITLAIAFLTGALAGTITGLIHVKLRVKDLLAGIIVMTALYSINLRIAGRANVPIFSQKTIFENAFLDSIVPAYLERYTVVILLFIITIIMKIILDLYLKTKSGYLLRAVGDNEVVVTSLAKDKGTIKILGLAIANAFVALAGAIYCQKNGFFEISAGTGTMVIGLASVIIGTKLFKRVGFLKPTTAVIVGSIIYQACIAFAISKGKVIFRGMAASDLKLITSTLFLIILVLSHERRRKVKANA